MYGDEQTIRTLINVRPWRRAAGCRTVPGPVGLGNGGNPRVCLAKAEPRRGPRLSA